MENQKNQGSAGKALVFFVIGVALMVGGMYISKNVDIPFQHTLAEQGIPLDLGKTIATIGVFLILFKLIEFFYLKPLTEAIDTRNNALQATFDEAEELKARMTELKTAYEEKLAKSEAEAREEIQRALAEAQQMKNQIIAEARTQADEIRRKADEDIEREKAKALVEMRTQVVELTLTATEKLIGESMDEDRQRRLVEKFIDTVEVGK
jgi:F-type H+-transporting ATPase subunit b